MLTLFFLTCIPFNSEALLTLITDVQVLYCGLRYIMYVYSSYHTLLESRFVNSSLEFLYLVLSKSETLHEVMYFIEARGSFLH